MGASGPSHSREVAAVVASGLFALVFLVWMVTQLPTAEQGVRSGVPQLAVPRQGLKLAAAASPRPVWRPPPAPPVSLPHPSAWDPHRVVLVVAHDLSNPSESVTWLKAQPLTSVVMQQGQRRLPRAGFADQGHWLASNIGGPAASYLQFILEHYDDLPPVMIFTEASDDYVAVNKVDVLKELDPNAYGFAKPVFNIMWRTMAFSEETRGLHRELLELYNGTDLRKHLGMPPAQAPRIRTACCGSMVVVARDRVLSRSKQLYQLLFDLVYTWREKGHPQGSLAQLRPEVSSHLNVLLEYQWHFLWGQPWLDTLPKDEWLYRCRSPWQFNKPGRNCHAPTPSPSASPSVFLPEQGPGAWQPEPSSSHPNPDNETVLVIARNQHKDSLHWLNEQPYRYVVMEKGLPEGTPNNLPLNRGLDSASYVQFILEHWERLPARMIFLHGHVQSEISGNYVDVLRGLDVHRYPYVGVAWIWINSLPEGTEVAMSPENIRAIFNRTALHKYLDLPPLDRFAIRTNCCSNFLVTRERVLARPKELYEHIFYLVYQQQPPIHRINWVLEVIWAHILGQPWLDSKPSIADMFPHFPPWDNFGEVNL